MSIKKIKEVYINSGFTLTPYSKDIIDEAIKKHKNLPAILIEYYTKVGAIAKESSFAIQILSPDKLYLLQDGEEKPRSILVFAEEMQGVINLGILKKDLKSDNPILYGAGDVFNEFLDEDYRYLAGDMYAASSEESDTSFLSILNLLWSIASNELKIENPLSQDILDPQIIVKKEKVEAKKAKIRLTNLAHDILQGKADVTLVTDEMINTVTTLDFSDMMSSVEITLLEKFVYLKSLSISNVDLSDISWIKNMNSLTMIHFTQTNLNDISPIASLTKLKEVHLYYNKLNDLSPLTKLKSLKKLYLHRNEITDISSFVNLSEKLEELDISENNISSIDTLSGLVNLDILDIGYNEIVDITSLSKLEKLRVLYLRGNKISDISALKDMKKLESLDLSKTSVKSLKPLQNYKHKMWSLDIRDTQIEDLEPMKGVEIVNFDK